MVHLARGQEFSFSNFTQVQKKNSKIFLKKNRNYFWKFGNETDLDCETGKKFNHFFIIVKPFSSKSSLSNVKHSHVIFPLLIRQFVIRAAHWMKYFPFSSLQKYAQTRLAFMTFKIFEMTFSFAYCFQVFQGRFLVDIFWWTYLTTGVDVK